MGNYGNYLKNYENWFFLKHEIFLWKILNFLKNDIYLSFYSKTPQNKTLPRRNDTRNVKWWFQWECLQMFLFFTSNNEVFLFWLLLTVSPSLREKTTKHSRHGKWGKTFFTIFTSLYRFCWMLWIFSVYFLKIFRLCIMWRSFLKGWKTIYWKFSNKNS